MFLRLAIVQDTRPRIPSVSLPLTAAAGLMYLCRASSLLGRSDGEGKESLSAFGDECEGACVVLLCMMFC